MKKILALAMALIMVMSLASVAFASEAAEAEPTTKLNMTAASGYSADRSYVAYRLLAASTDVDAGKYAYSYTANTDLNAVLLNVLNLSSTASAQDVVEAIKLNTTAAAMKAFAADLYRAILAADITPDKTWTGTTVDLPQGYYLIADVTNFEGQSERNSLVMVDTIGNKELTITIKPEKFTDTKKIDDENDSIYKVEGEQEHEDDRNWQDVADYDIGDSIPYDIFTMLPESVDIYNYYAILIQDTADEGLTFEESSFKLTVNAKPVTLAKVGTEDAASAHFLYEIVANENKSNTLYVYPNYNYTLHEKDAEGKVQVVGPNNTYGGDIKAFFAADEDGTYGTMSGATISFEYTCKLNENAKVGVEGNENTYVLKYSNNPYGDGFGQTVGDTNIALTFKFNVDKKDGAGKPLGGADFALYKFVAESATEKDGLEKLDQVNAWGKWVELEDIKSVAADEKDDETTAGIDESATKYHFSWTGIDDGYYKLVETVTPAGYNSIEDIVFKVANSHAKVLDGATNPTLVSLSVTHVSGGSMGDTSIDNDAGSISIAVINKSGAELPSTGGMGTTMLYVIGGIMVAFAVVMLVTKKRMSAEV